MQSEFAFFLTKRVTVNAMLRVSSTRKLFDELFTVNELTRHVSQSI